MDWLQYKNGHLAKTKHGFFFVYGTLNLWYVEYEAGAATYGDGIAMPLTSLGLRKPNAAKAIAEKYAKRLDAIPAGESLEEE